MSSIYDRRMVARSRNRSQMERPEAAQPGARTAAPIPHNGTMPRLDRIYTKTGDEGMTGLGGGQRVAKDSQRVETYGTVDELNSQIGVGARDRPVRAPDDRAAADPERAVRPRGRPRDARDQPGAPSRPDRRGTPHREARAADRRAQRGRRAADQLPAARRLARRRPAPRRADGLPARGAGGHDARARRGDRADRPPLPQPPVGCAVRDGPLREPRARRRPSRCGSRASDVAALEAQELVHRRA